MEDLRTKTGTSSFTSMSRISLCGEYQQDSCGYCKLSRGTSFGLQSTHMLARDYDMLMSLGFRRSGTFFYKPIMQKTCCPQYTIRLKSDLFQPSKSQRQLLRKLDKFLLTRGPESKLTVHTEKARFSEERFLLFKKYQIAVHGDSLEEVTEKSFSRFLVDSALVDGEIMCGEYRCGTYHQLYRLDGALVAVGVLDILPSGVSSVYLFYDTDMKHLVLGKYSALREIEFCRNLGLEYYYMGFYIHTCPKMKYKGDYSPSELLCPVSLQWFPLTECKPKLDRFRFTPFREDLFARREAVALACSQLSPNDASATASGEEGRNPSDMQLQQGPTNPSDRARIEGEDVSPEERSQLQQFVPMIGPIDISRIPLDLNHPTKMFILDDITTEGQAILSPILESWASLSGQTMAERIVIKLA